VGSITWAAELRFHFLDAAFDERLLFLGGVVFGVFRQVALGTRLGDGVDHRRTLDGLEALQLFLQEFGATLGNRNGAHCLVQQK
jgi:hypothetical protein